MMCYRDMTFCTFYKDCVKAPKCHRPLTPAVREAAAKWWGPEFTAKHGDAPIAQFGEKPECHEMKS